MKPDLLKQCVAGFIGTFALIFVGVGAIYNHAGAGPGVGLLGIALARLIYERFLIKAPC